MLAIALLLVSVVGHVVKGLDVEEALVALAVVSFLFVHHDDFKAPGNPSSAASGAERIARRRSRSPSWAARSASRCDIRTCRSPRSREAVTERLVGIQSVDLPPRIDHLMTPAMLSIGIGIALAFCWLLFRPAVAPRVTSFRPMSRERARFLVERYGGDSLSYFALRDDKEWFGFRDTLVSYKVHNGIALVSPDPIGPVGQRTEAWARSASSPTSTAGRSR